jgi:hypothetical protein
MAKVPVKNFGVLCVARYTSVAWCGRSLGDNDAVFTDAQHALRHYTEPKGNHGLVACLNCREAYNRSVANPRETR